MQMAGRGGSRYSGCMKNILVLGGSGFVGREVCEALSRQRWRFTVPTRRLRQLQPILNLPLLQPVQASVHDEAALAGLIAGHDAVVNLVAILHGDAAAFHKAHVELPEKIARACAAAGVRRLVHVSALGAAADAPSMYQRSKAQGEAVLQAAAQAGQLDLTVLRPSVIFGAQDRFLNLFAQLQSTFPVMPLAGADTRFQPVWVGDVARAVLQCLQARETIGQTYELCGPDVCTLRELVQLAGRAAGVNGGRGRPVLALPEALGRLQAWLMEMAPGEPLMSRDNLDSMKVDNVANGALPGLSALGITPARLAAVAPTYLGAKGLRSRLNELRRVRRRG